MTAKKTPFYDAGIAAGAEMRELFGYWLPWEYRPGHIQEHLGTRERVSVCDLDYMAEFKIKGPGALEIVQQLFTNDFSDLAVGRIRYTAMCDEDGRMVDDGTVWRMESDEFTYISGDEADHDWLERNSTGYDVELTNLTAKWTTLAVQGPASGDVIKKIASVNPATLRYYGFARVVAAGVDCVLARMGYTGEFGFELHFDPDAAATVWDSLIEAGAEDGIVPCGQAALESLRQEAGYLLVGNDHNRQTNPLEAGLGRTVRFSKPAFNGREALAKIMRNGVERRLVWLKLAGPAVVVGGDAITLGGNTIGTVTSGSYSPTLERGVAMGYVAAAYAIDGVDAVIQTKDGREVAFVSVMPLYDPGDVRTKGTYSR